MAFPNYFGVGFQKTCRYDLAAPKYSCGFLSFQTLTFQLSESKSTGKQKKGPPSRHKNQAKRKRCHGFVGGILPMKITSFWCLILGQNLLNHEKMGKPKTSISIPRPKSSKTIEHRPVAWNPTLSTRKLRFYHRPCSLNPPFLWPHKGALQKQRGLQMIWSSFETVTCFLFGRFRVICFTNWNCYPSFLLAQKEDPWCQQVFGCSDGFQPEAPRVPDLQPRTLCHSHATDPHLAPQGPPPVLRVVLFLNKAKPAKKRPG